MMPGIILMGASLILVFGKRDWRTKFLNDDKWSLLGLFGFFFGMVVSVLGIPYRLLAIIFYLWSPGMG